MTTDKPKDPKEQLPANAFYNTAGRLTQVFDWVDKKREAGRLNRAVKAVAPLGSESIQALCGKFQNIMSLEEFEAALKERGELHSKEYQQLLKLAYAREAESEDKTAGWRWISLKAGLTPERVEKLMQNLEADIATRHAAVMHDLRALRKDKKGMKNFTTLEGGESDKDALKGMQEEVTAQEAAA